MHKLLLLTSLLLSVSLYAQAPNLETAEEEAYRYSIQDLYEFNLYTKECNDSIVKSCHLLADIYREGVDVRPNKPKALALYKKACDVNYMDSCTSYATMLETGNGVKKDLNKAAKYYHLACEGGSGISCLVLGSMYRNNKAEADKYNKLACELGYKSMCEE